MTKQQNTILTNQRTNASLLALLVLLCLISHSNAFAGTLPEDQADALYHAYEGGGVEISGPSILVRKKVADDISISANYYVDMVSSASIDVVTTASKYSEERTQYSLGMDYLYNNTIISFNFTNSSENDYEADTASFSISQNFFSNLTTLSLNYANGSDVVMKNGQDDFSEELERENYRLDLSQIITKNFVLSLAAEGITDQGFLNNPYRLVRFVDPTVPDKGYSFQPEIYPDTKTSRAIALTGRYYLDYRAAIYVEYRDYNDTWGIDASNVEIGYIHPLDDTWTFETSIRFYEQTQADFYNDLFPFQDAQNFLARDKELSTFDSVALTVGATYDFKMSGDIFDRGSVNLYLNFIEFDYDNFRDITVDAAPGSEPLYSFDATVIRAFVSFWF